MGPVIHSKAKKLKYVDDGSVAVSINLKNCLRVNQSERARPLTFRQRTNHILPPENNLLQYYLADTEKYTKRNGMRINKKKTQVMLFNKSRKFDFFPEMVFEDATQVEVISETKIVGLILTDNLSWHRNTEYITQKARRKLWIIRRMASLDLSHYQMYDVYCKEVRSILNSGVWSTCLAPWINKEGLSSN